MSVFLGLCGGAVTGMGATLAVLAYRYRHEMTARLYALGMFGAVVAIVEGAVIGFVATSY